MLHTKSEARITPTIKKKVAFANMFFTSAAILTPNITLREYKNFLAGRTWFAILGFGHLVGNL